jgi:archaellum component FlaC
MSDLQKAFDLQTRIIDETREEITRLNAQYKELVEAASDQAITWNEDRCDHDQYNQREKAIERLEEALSKLRMNDCNATGE